MRQFFCRQYFGEMEQHSLHGDGAAERRYISRDGQKSGKHVFEKRLSPKKGHQKNTPIENHNFSHFSTIFITFYILQHYGRHVTTPSHRHPVHKGNPAELGGRTPKK